MTDQASKVLKMCSDGLQFGIIAERLNLNMVKLMFIIEQLKQKQLLR